MKGQGGAISTLPFFVPRAVKGVRENAHFGFGPEPGFNRLGRD